MNASRGFGAGAGALSGHTTGTVQSSVASAAAQASVSRGSTGKAGRSAEEIEQEFDRNKGAIHALYTRALREQADLQGKMVIEFTIAPEARRLLDDDEYLVRRRIHRDVRRALEGAGL